LKRPLQALCDIIAEWVNEHVYSRKRIRYLFMKESMLDSSLQKGKRRRVQTTEITLISVNCLKAPSHRVLAIFRGENEGFLKVSVDVVEEKALKFWKRILSGDEYLFFACERSDQGQFFKRLMAPSMETEMQAACQRESRCRSH